MALRSLLLLAILPVVLPVVLPGAAMAQAPRTLALQGVLAGSNGVPKPNGNYTLTLRLFDVPTGGAALWTEANKVVTVAGGKGGFSTVLGTPTAFGALAFDKPYYLEVQVSGDPAMSPRLALSAAPYTLASSGTATLALPFAGSANVAAPGTALRVTNTGNGQGIVSEALAHVGVQGISKTWVGVWGYSDSSSGVHGESNSWVGTSGRSNTGAGVYGESNAWAGVWGQSKTSSGVAGLSDSWAGVWGESKTSTGVVGKSGTWTGVYGESASDKGVHGLSTNWVGVWGTSNTSTGVRGESVSGWGVQGESTGNVGVIGQSRDNDGVQGVSRHAWFSGVAGINTTGGNGVYGRSDGGGYAGRFDGRVRVNVLEILGGADLAEKFNTTDAAESAEPGTVMAIDPANPGRLCVAEGAYNRKVAGVVSGANKLEAGMVLTDPAAPKGGVAVALTGRVWVKCDASNGPIEPGDMLTTSQSAGRAMRVSDYGRAMGATIGKAMTGLEAGEGLVLVLVSLN